MASLTTRAQVPDFDFREVEYGPYQTTFHLFAPADAKKVVVRIYKDGLGGKPLKTQKMTYEDGLWTAVVKGDLMGRFYTFDMGRGECPGVFAKAVGVNGQRGAIIDFEKTFPDDWCCDYHPVIKSPADLVVYELHHRDFSIARPDAKYPGKFLALTEPWAIQHLKSLGVNYDYGSVDETRLSDNKYNWGYDPVNYNVPEGGYSTDPYNPVARIKEFKQMVQALHKEGIAVILDVVYNHTYDIDHSNFQRTYPDYYYRKTADGQYSNGSGCGNETASEKPMMRRFMKESVKYWYEEFHVDGFRFDLMGCHRGPFSDDTKPGWLGGAPDCEESLKFGIVGAIRHPQVDMSKVNYSKAPWALQPTQMMSYVSCHDDMCLVDRLKASIPSLQGNHKSQSSKFKDQNLDELIRLDLLAQTAVFTSQGVPFMLSGEELLRDKKGVHNSFESPDSINHLDWANLQRYPQVFKYYQDLIALRKHHPAFRLGDADLVRKHLEFLDAPKGVVAFRLKNYAGRDDWRNIVVILNASREAQQVAVPKAMYTIVCQNGEINEQSTSKTFERRVNVSPQSALIMYE